MIDWASTDAFAGQIHDAFSVEVVWKPSSGPGKPIRAVKLDDAVQGFMGAGATMRMRAFEVRQVDVGIPDKSDRIVEGSIEWRVIDITRRDDVGAWILIVES